ncbi:hypothetical protein F5Y08DRAFT_315486 [Xylaria arbuscula]|nr:hypothetical protein F5Y08DRAFT_315486 [Xylaria arbuscula]
MFLTKPIFSADLAVFTTDALLCALAPTSGAFISGRAVVGFAMARVVRGAFCVRATIIVSLVWFL